MNSILLDTSFCIRLLKKDDPFHVNAVEYFEFFLEQKVEIFLSSIVIAEYSVKDNINNLPLRSMKIMPFDFFDGKIAGEFHSILLNNKPLLSSIGRLVIKDDCKLIAQIYNRKIEAYITKDKKSFTQIIYPLLSARKFSVETLDLTIPLKIYKSELF